jgi:hypothetical protein
MGRRVSGPITNDRGHGAVPDGETDETEWTRLVARARQSGVDLSEADARDMHPYFARHQRWLAEMRHVLGEDIEPATVFRVDGAGDGRG